MTASSLIGTTVLLGLFVLSGGAYGVLYCAAQLRSSRSTMHAGYACYVAQFTFMFLACVYTPLSAPWKLLLVLSGLAYAFIPSVTWRYIDRLHHSR
jgi:hypothetical protein